MLKKSFLDAMWQMNMGFNLPDVISIKRKTEEIKKKKKKIMWFIGRQNLNFVPFHSPPF